MLPSTPPHEALQLAQALLALHQFNNVYVRMHYVFDLRISEEELLKFYRGHARHVHARDRSGLRVAFPVEALRPFVQADGIHGTFRVDVSANGKLRGVRRLA